MKVTCERLEISLYFFLQKWMAWGALAFDCNEMDIYFVITCPLIAYIGRASLPWQPISHDIIRNSIEAVSHYIKTSGIVFILAEHNRNIFVPLSNVETIIESEQFCHRVLVRTSATRMTASSSASLFLHVWGDIFLTLNLRLRRERSQLLRSWVVVFAGNDTLLMMADTPCWRGTRIWPSVFAHITSASC